MSTFPVPARNEAEWVEAIKSATKIVKMFKLINMVL
jgi:hypothetical protein